jgi:preprotein translocase subunit SecF
MMIGIVVGTYSSVYVASPILLAWQGRGRKK